MKIVSALVGALFLMCLAMFCVFGFLAAGEPAPAGGHFMAFRIGYAAVGVASVVGIGWLVSSAARR